MSLENDTDYMRLVGALVEKYEDEHVPELDPS